MRASWRLLTNKYGFGFFFAGAALSNIGTWAQNLAAVLLVYELSGSTFLVGMVSLAQFASPVVLAPWTGLVADQFDRRQVIMLTQLVGSVVSALLAAATISGHITVWGVLLGVLGMGICQAFQAPAILSLTPLLADYEDRELALGLNSSQFNIARAIGPLLANLIIVQFGIGHAFLFNTLSFFVLVLALRFVHPRPVFRNTSRVRLRDTVRLIRADRWIVPLMLMSVVISGVSDVATTLSPALSVGLSGTADWAGYMVSAFGVGAVLTAFLLMPWLARFSRRLVPTLVVQAFALAALATTPNLVVAICTMAVFGGTFMAASNRTVSLIQAAVPTETLGRVMAIWLVAFLGSRPVYAALNGFLADTLGVRVAVAVMGAITLAAAGAFQIFRSRRPA